MLMAAVVSVAALLWYYAHNQLLLYGDAVAHINIARRVVDTRSWLSSFFQFGTVWLPLQHVAMLPFVWNDQLWRSGIAGAVPGMMAYALGAAGIFRLVSGRAPRYAACIAAAIYALNPNLLYLQTTAMNEPIFLAFFIWAIVYLDEMLRAAPNSAPTGPKGRSLTREQALERCGIMLAGAAWTRYDGWFVAAIMGAIVSVVAITWWRRTSLPQRRRALAKSLVEFLLLNALIPVFWLAYNHRVSGRAMDWANGPYSAKAIAAQTTQRGAPPYPGEGHPITAATYLMKAGQLNVGSAPAGRLLLSLAILGTVVAIRRFRQYKVWLLLWLPLPFYALSIAYGSVPIFIPVWWPFSYYNVRYGLELLPVFAVFPVLLALFLAGSVRNRKREIVIWTLLVVSFAGGYLAAWSEVPITLREARVNAHSRVAMEEGAGQLSGSRPAKCNPFDVPGRARRSLAACRHSVKARHQRSRPSRLGVGAARSCPSRRLHHRLPGRPGVDGGPRAPPGTERSRSYQRTRAGPLHHLRSPALVRTPSANILRTPALLQSAQRRCTSRARSLL